MKPKTICAWCGVWLGGEPDGDDISHGICPGCRDTFFGKGLKPKDTMPGLDRDSKWALTEIAERN